MYWEYIKERENCEIIERPWGFAVIQFLDEFTVYLKDIYIKPENRRAGRATELLDEVENIAKSSGFTRVLGSCSPAAKGSTESLKAILASGFKLQSCDKDIIYLIKEL